MDESEPFSLAAALDVYLRDGDPLHHPTVDSAYDFDSVTPGRHGFSYHETDRLEEKEKGQVDETAQEYGPFQESATPQEGEPRQESERVVDLTSMLQLPITACFDNATSGLARTHVHGILYYLVPSDVIHAVRCAQQDQSSLCAEIDQHRRQRAGSGPTRGPRESASANPDRALKNARSRTSRLNRSRRADNIEAHATSMVAHLRPLFDAVMQTQPDD